MRGKQKRVIFRRKTGNLQAVFVAAIYMRNGILSLVKNFFLRKFLQENISVWMSVCEYEKKNSNYKIVDMIQNRN